MKMHMYRGSHLPVLMKVVGMTTGPILELGCGAFSTPYLHWVCYQTKRRLVTYENQPAWYDIMLAHIAANRRNMQSDFHEVHLVEDWDAMRLNEPWSVAFVDHEPGRRRKIDIARLHHAEYVVVHDTERAKRHAYQWGTVFRKYRYRFEYDLARPTTTVVSDRHDVSRLSIP